ncbi:hypothetical protein P7C70_g329, partial [Phenoliferia sp. Uapishka_3]
MISSTQATLFAGLLLASPSVAQLGYGYGGYGYGNRLGGGGYAGIGVGSFVALIILLGLAFWCCRRRRGRNTRNAVPQAQMSSVPDQGYYGGQNSYAGGNNAVNNTQVPPQENNYSSQAPPYSSDQPYQNHNNGQLPLQLIFESVKLMSLSSTTLGAATHPSQPMPAANSGTGHYAPPAGPPPKF